MISIPLSAGECSFINRCVKMTEASIEDGQVCKGTDVDDTCTPWSDLWFRKMISVLTWGKN